jgi:hypothetical protein
MQENGSCSSQPTMNGPQTNAESAGSPAGGEKRFERPLMIVRAAVCRLRRKAPQKASKNGPVY